MKFVVFLSLIVTLLLVQAQKPDFINGHYVYEGQSNFKNFLRAYGITDEDKISQLAESKPELFMEKVGPNVTVTFVVSPTFNSSFSFIEGEEYDADFFGVGKTFKTISVFHDGNSVMSREIENPNHYRLGTYDETSHTMVFFANGVVGTRFFKRVI